MFSRILNYFEDFEQKWRFQLNLVGTVCIFFAFWVLHQVEARINPDLPDLINIPNFIGNIDSTLPAILVGYTFGWLLTRTSRLNGSKVFRLAVLAGTLTGLAVNVFIESNFGMNLVNQPNVSDPLDVLWGTVFCLVACFVCFKVEKVEG